MDADNKNEVNGDYLLINASLYSHTEKKNRTYRPFLQFTNNDDVSKQWKYGGHQKLTQYARALTGEDCECYTSILDHVLMLFAALHCGSRAATGFHSETWSFQAPETP